MQTVAQTICTDLAKKALKEFDERTAISDQVIADLYTGSLHTLGEVARATGTTRTGVMLALYRLNLLPGQHD